MKNIYRWGLMRNTKNENLSEHSLEVAIIAHALAVIKNTRFSGNADPQYIATAAMFHDTSEILTGDLPTPIKYHNPEIKTAYKEIETAAQNSLLSMLPDDIKGSYEKLYCPDSDSETLIKAADKLSALIKCIEEIKMGNDEFCDAKASTEKYLKDMHLPEVDTFMEEFLPSFYLPLDRQQISL